ncbi:MAG: hypothetical protein JSS64_06820 [Bacteroidetes bacterium]|nr:hypothetical protein [Bacteroidota bacterium]
MNKVKNFENWWDFVYLCVRCNPTDDRADINRLTEKRTDQAHPPPDKTTI